MLLRFEQKSVSKFSKFSKFSRQLRRERSQREEKQIPDGDGATREGGRGEREESAGERGEGAREGQDKSKARGHFETIPITRNIFIEVEEKKKERESTKC